MSGCPHARAFRTTVNMSAAEVRAWKKRRERSCRSIRRRSNGKSAVAELEMVARMLSKSPARWSAAECRKARDLVNFVKRHRAGRGSPCSRRRLIALRDWASHPPRCKVPADPCKSARGRG